MFTGGVRCLVHRSQRTAPRTFLLHHHGRTTTIRSAHAIVHHADAYRKQVEGLHGQQLSLAHQEGIGKDDLPYDPFLEDEIRALEENQAAAADSESEEDNDDEEKGEETQNAVELDAAEKVNLDDEEDETDDEEETAEEMYEEMNNYNRRKYNKDGSLRRNKSELAVLRAGFPAFGKVAIIELAGSQYKVTTDDVVIVNKLNPKVFSLNTTHDLTQVLLQTTDAFTIIGMPYVEGAKVTVLIEEITRDKKVIVFKKHGRKHGSQRRTGHRRDVTILRVLDIQLPEEYQDLEFVDRPDPAPLIKKDRPRNITYKDDGSGIVHRA